MKRHHTAGFTLVELLVVFGVIAALASLTVSIVDGTRKRAGLSREIAYSRQLMGAYSSYAADHDGDLMPGFGAFPAVDDQGAPLPAHVAMRYPWRLAPYLGYDMKVLWGNDADDRLRKLSKGPRPDYVYAVSVQPAMGINAMFVGGDYQSLSPERDRVRTLYGGFCVTRLAQAARPASLVVFASAATIYEGKRLPGYFKVEAPFTTKRNWSQAAGASPVETGYVDFRWGGKAVVAMLDGHVEVLTWEQMNDMQRWSNQAALAQSTGWKLGNGEEPASGGMIDLGESVDAKPTNEPL